MSRPLQPQHDAPMCKCGAPLQPSAYYDGMIRPEGEGLCELTRLRCVSSGIEFQCTVERTAQARWSVGAYEQQAYIDREDSKR